jgi:hypothetical protein
MTGYSVNYLGTDGKIKTYICFAFLKSSYSFLTEDGFIFLANFSYSITKKYINLIIETINEIQPCKLVTKDGVDYIAYKRIGLFSNDVILLSFIRHLWYSSIYDKEEGKFSITFFEKLKELNKDKKNLSAMERLLTANKYASEECNIKINCNHSNAWHHESLKIKKLPEDFYTKQIGSCKDFLCIE